MGKTRKSFGWAKRTKRTKLAKRRAQLAILAAALGFASWGVWSVRDVGETCGVGAVASAQETASNGERALAVVAKEPEKCAVLLVGVDKYKTLTSLQYASSDVRALRDALVEIGFPFKSIRTLVSDGDYNDRPSREAILATLDEILAASGPESTVLIALSGHGFETENGDAAFCPEDVEVKIDDGKTAVKSETAILIEEVAERLRTDDARFKLLIVDACREPATTERAADATARSFAPIPEPNGVAFLQSCESQELSWEHPALKGGVFSAFFAKGLRGAADSDGDGGVSFLDVCNYATSQTQRFVKDERGAAQTPFYRFSGVVDFWLKPPTRAKLPPVAVGASPISSGTSKDGSGLTLFALLALTGGLIVFAVWAMQNQRRITEALKEATRGAKGPSSDGDALQSSVATSENDERKIWEAETAELRRENREALASAQAATRKAEEALSKAEAAISELTKAREEKDAALASARSATLKAEEAEARATAERQAREEAEDKAKKAERKASVAAAELTKAREAEERAKAERQTREEAEEKAKEAWSAFDLGGVANVEKAIKLMKESLASVELTANRRALQTFEEKLEACPKQSVAVPAHEVATPQTQTPRPKVAPAQPAQPKVAPAQTPRPKVAPAQPPRPKRAPAQPAQALNGWSAEHKAGTRQTLQIKGVEYAFRYCPPGTFLMGSPESEKGRWNDEKQHEVTLTNGFWLLETPVTQAMWKSVVGSNPSYFKSSERNPVDSVSWNDCQYFIKKLNSEGLALGGFKFRLPTEAEWEYACRAGTTTAYSWGDSLNGDKANCDGNYPCGTSTKGKYLKCPTMVGSYGANPWGLYDMHGNVLEWCADWYDGKYYEKTDNAQNPINVAQGSNRVLCGGSWNSFAEHCRSAHRYSYDPTSQRRDCGFRLALGREL